jgi:predicted amidohydrolase
MGRARCRRGQVNLIHCWGNEDWSRLGEFLVGCVDNARAARGPILESRLEFAGEFFVCAPSEEVVARADRGSEEILMADIDLSSASDSHARRLFLRDRRPELYADWLGR